MKTPLLRTLFAGVALATLVTPSLNAAVLVNYSFTGGSAAPTSQDANVNAPPATPNAQWVGMSGGSGSGFSGAGNAFAFSNATPASANLGQYFEFTLTANPGYELNLDNMTFQLGGSGASFTVNANVRSSVGSYGSDLTMTPGPVTTATYTVPSTSTSYATFTVDLTNPVFDGLTTITFRVYPFDNRNDSTAILRMDNFSVNGDVIPIPEPTGAALLTVSLMGLLLFRRLPFQTRCA